MSILNLSSPIDGDDSGSIPAGVIVIWSGSADNIPSGWHICDGTQGTPNLKDRFVLGAGEAHEVGDSGGEEEVTLTASQMPTHNHSIFRCYGTNASIGASDTGKLLGADSKGSTVGNTSPINQAGGSDAHNNMPPYYTLCYIMKL